MYGHLLPITLSFLPLLLLFRLFLFISSFLFFIFDYYYFIPAYFHYLILMYFHDVQISSFLSMIFSHFTIIFAFTISSFIFHEYIDVLGDIFINYFHCATFLLSLFLSFTLFLFSSFHFSSIILIIFDDDIFTFSFLLFDYYFLRSLFSLWIHFDYFRHYSFLFRLSASSSFFFSLSILVSLFFRFLIFQLSFSSSIISFFIILSF